LDTGFQLQDQPTDKILAIVWLKWIRAVPLGDGENTVYAISEFT
jgi:hypothetical protein